MKFKFKIKLSEKEVSKLLDLIDVCVGIPSSEDIEYAVKMLIYEKHKSAKPLPKLNKHHVTTLEVLDEDFKNPIYRKGF